jgi:hypothetical protein
VNTNHSHAYTLPTANGIEPAWENQPVGTVDQVVEHLAPYLKIGYRHLIAGFSTPHDEESMVRLVVF